MTNLPKAPKYEGVDPLTKGKRYHNDNTKADSTFNDAPAQVEIVAVEDVEVPENTEDVQTDSTPAEGDGSDTAEAEQPTE